MTIVNFNDRVRETSIATGTGDKSLAGAVSNFRAFSAVKADGDTFAVTMIMSPDFETAWVRYNSGANTLTPLFVFESSNGGALVNWVAGTKDVLEGLPAKLAQGALALVSTFNFRLTPSTGVAAVNSAVTGATSIFCTPYHGNQRARFLGSYWTASAGAEDSLKFTDAQSGTTSTSSPNITGIDSSKIPLGYKISGTGIPANAVVGAIPGPTSVTIYVSGSPTNGTASATNTITFKAPANTGYDLYDDMTSATLKLQAVARSAIFTDPTYGSQDGVAVHPSISTLRHIGKCQTSNTDGQLDYGIAGRYRRTIWNRYNRIPGRHREYFSASGTWYRAFASAAELLIMVGGGTTGTTSFGTWATANSAGASGDLNASGQAGPAFNTDGSQVLNLVSPGGAAASPYSKPGAASASTPMSTTNAMGIANVTVTGGTGGGYAERNVYVTSLAASETVTIAGSGNVVVEEMLEI